MRKASRIALLGAAVALPLAVILGSCALNGSDRVPQVPEKVRIGDPTDPVTRAPRPTRPDNVPGSRPPAPPPGTDERGNVLPPPPVDDDADDADETDDTDDETDDADDRDERPDDE